MEVDYLKMQFESLGDPQKSGIYLIHCLANQKTYVGQSRKIAQRWNKHKVKLRRGEHWNSILQNIWNKYGGSSLEWIVIENCSTESLNDREAYWASKIDKSFLMNQAPIGKVVELAPEVREKMRIAHLGKKQSPQAIANRVAALKERNAKYGTKRGFSLSEEARQKISKANKGKKKPDGFGEKLRGKKRSPETIEKILATRTANRSWKKSPEARARLSEALKGRKLSEETKQKLSWAHIGRDRGQAFSDKMVAVWRERKRKKNGSIDS